jgi:hypothetical protein
MLLKAISVGSVKRCAHQFCDGRNSPRIHWKIDMFKGSTRLAVDKWGLVEVTEPTNLTVTKDSNLSLVEYELVNILEE